MTHYHCWAYSIHFSANHARENLILILFKACVKENKVAYHLFFPYSLNEIQQHCVLIPITAFSKQSLQKNSTSRRFSTIWKGALYFEGSVSPNH